MTWTINLTAAEKAGKLLFRDLTSLQQYVDGMEPHVCNDPVISLSPVCGSDESNNGQLSRLLADIVMAVSDKVDTEVGTMCRSTEEMIVDIERVNAENDGTDTVIFSTDVSVMYPSLDIDTVAKEFLNCDLQLDVDPVELAL